MRLIICLILLHFSIRIITIEANLFCDDFCTNVYTDSTLVHSYGTDNQNKYHQFDFTIDYLQPIRFEVKNNDGEYLIEGIVDLHYITVSTNEVSLWIVEGDNPLCSKSRLSNHNGNHYQRIVIDNSDRLLDQSFCYFTLSLCSENIYYISNNVSTFSFSSLLGITYSRLNSILKPFFTPGTNPYGQFKYNVIIISSKVAVMQYSDTFQYSIV